MGKNWAEQPENQPQKPLEASLASITLTEDEIADVIKNMKTGANSGNPENATHYAMITVPTNQEAIDALRRASVEYDKGNRGEDHAANRPMQRFEQTLAAKFEGVGSNPRVSHGVDRISVVMGGKPNREKLAEALKDLSEAAARDRQKAAENGPKL